MKKYLLVIVIMLVNVVSFAQEYIPAPPIPFAGDDEGNGTIGDDDFIPIDGISVTLIFTAILLIFAFYKKYKKKKDIVIN